MCVWAHAYITHKIQRFVFASQTKVYCATNSCDTMYVYKNFQVGFPFARVFMHNCVQNNILCKKIHSDLYTCSVHSRAKFLFTSCIIMRKICVNIRETCMKLLC